MKPIKMNLIIFAQNKSLSRRLSNYVEKDNVDKCREFLMTYFPSHSIQYGHDRIIMEMADLIASLRDEPDITQYLDECSHNVQTLITQYHRKKEEASKQLSRVYRQSKTNYVHMTKEQRAAVGYTPETVQNVLKQLDAKETYERYTQGYEFERYQAYEWLRYQINAALSGRTHNVIIEKKKPINKVVKPRKEKIKPMVETVSDLDIEHPWDREKTASSGSN